MDSSISRSEKKRQAHRIEQLALELAELPASDIKRLPCDEQLRREIILTRPLKGGARKRQIKHIAKELRHSSSEPLLLFLENQKGSKLKKTGEFHELERLRDRIITEVLHDAQVAQTNGERLDVSWQSEAVAAATGRFPDIDTAAVKKSALRFARSRKPVHSREIFRILKAAHERLQFAARQENNDGI